MKEKLLVYLRLHKGGVSMFVLSLVFTLLGGLVAYALNCRETGLVSMCTGVLSAMCINVSSESVGLRLSKGDRPAVLGVVLGTIITICLI